MSEGISFGSLLAGMVNLPDVVGTDDEGSNDELIKPSGVAPLKRPRRRVEWAER